MVFIGSYINQLFRIPWGFFILFISFIGKIIPKNDNLWVFGNKHGFIDNPQYLFEYLNHSSHSIQCVWIAEDKTTRNLIRQIGYDSEKKISIRGIYLALRARVGVVANGASDINRAIGPSIFLVNLWHGTPLKKILMDSSAENIKAPLIGKPISWLSRWIYAQSLSCVDLLPTPSEPFSNIMSNAFRIPTERAPVTGYARSDVILGDKNKNTGYLPCNIQQIINDPEIKHIIFYAPTWRRPGTLWNVFPQFESDNWRRILLQNKACLVIKYHPFTDKKIIESNSKILRKSGAIVLDNSFDVNRFYPFVSVLVTDYSSMVFDFSLLNRPIYILKSYLYEQSNKDEFYEDIEYLAGDAMISDFNDLEQRITHLMSSGLEPTTATRNFISDRYTKFHDVNNCQRIVQEIFKRIS